MRRLILASAAAATLVAGLGVASTALAQAGSYQRSCRNPQNVNGTLTAECMDAQGQYHSTSIAAGQCKGEIGNANGTLVCAGAQGTSGPVIGPNPQQQTQRGGNDNRGGGFDNRGGGYRGNDNRGDRGNDNTTAAVVGALLGGALVGSSGVVVAPPPPPPVYGDRRYGDPRYDWRYQQGGYGYGRRAGEWVPIRDRADWLNRQIDRLERDGRIDFRDVRDYHRQLSQLQDRESQYMRRGRLDQRARNDLDRQFNDLTEEVRRDARAD